MGSCAPIRTDLASCLMRTDCVLKQGNTAQDCLQHHMAELPEECQHLYKSYVACRRGMLDMRKRFRGNVPPSSSSNNPAGGTTVVSSAAADDVSPNDPSQATAPDAT